ncbi:hypothetical protein NKJ84_16060 [Mesorhizobium sp. M0048]|uniref:hypothetical protein n=1 Tax=Mesorhizobium sp. M0048 TaxID=2956860 RepID=UPI003335773F
MLIHRKLDQNQQESVNELKEKIKAKMDVAKTLGAFFAGLLAALIAFVGDSAKLKDVLESTRCHFCLGIDIPLVGGIIYKYMFLVAILSTTISIVLFFSTMYAYDRLLMPREFWEEKHSAEVLYTSMSEAWNKLFNMAIVFLAVGLCSFVFVLLQMGLIEIATLILCVAGALLYSRRRVPPKAFRPLPDAQAKSQPTAK